MRRDTGSSKHHQKFWTSFVLVPLVACTLHGVATGQALPLAGFGRFVIAADNVGPDVSFPAPNTPSNGGIFLPWVTGTRSSSDSISHGRIPPARWEQLRDLGIDLGLMYLADICMHNGGIGQLREAAGRSGVMLGLSDIGITDGITNYSGMERIAIHPESERMVDTADWFYPETVDDPSLVDADLDFSHFALTPALNAVRFRRHADAHPRVVRGWLLRRMLYPGDFRPMYQGKLRKDGVYYLSMRLRYDNVATPIDDAVTNDTTTILQLALADERSGTIHRFALRGRDFYTAEDVRLEPFEALLDIIRVSYDEESDLIGITTGLSDDPDSNVPWPGMNDGPAITPAEYSERLGFELQYMPFSPKRPVLLLDAVLLSCGKAFALFNPDSPFIPATWRPRPIEYLDSSITQMCRPGNSPPVALVMLDESDASSGNIDAARFVSHRVRSRSLGATLPYVYGPAAMGLGNYGLYTHAFSDAIEGLYSYHVSLFDDTGERLPLPGVTGYYAAQFSQRDTYARMRGMTEHFGHFAAWHRATQEQCDWIPAIQNHAYGYMRGDPYGRPAGDTEWLREPTIAELRCSVNLALAYGAKGIMYYVFSSTPGQDTTRAEDVGMKGFLTYDHCKRARNSYGETLWDEIRAFNTGDLRILGDSLYPLRFWRGFSVEQHPESLLDGKFLLRVTTEARGIPDADEATYVEATEFDHPDIALRSGRGFIVLVNKRSDEHGSRTLRVSLRACQDPDMEWKVTDVLSRREYRTAGYNEQHAALSSGFTVVLPPGGATLLRLEAVETDGTSEAHAFLLGQNYPNPAVNITRIPFSIPHTAIVRMRVFDALGRLVSDMSAMYGAGSYTLPLRVDGFIAGIYTYRLSIGDRVINRRMIVY